MGLKRQLDDVKAVPDKDFIPLLADVAERANEVIPMEHFPRASQVSLVELPIYLSPSVIWQN